MLFPIARLSPVLVFLTLGAAAQAQAQAIDPGKAPGAEQLLRVPVGGTHIPLHANPQKLSNPYEGNSDAIVQGRTLFHSMNCVGCHGPQGGGAIGPPLSDRDWIYGSEPAQIYLSILQGRPNGMPSFAGALPSDSIWKLAAYVATLSKPATAPVLEQRPEKQTGKK